ncbi:MAG: ABC transporter permease [Candidatus Hodarchaeota archaeon]
MKILSIIALVKKEIKKLFRVPAYLFMAILFPLVLTGAFGLAFGSLGGTGGETQYTIGVVDLDESKWSDFFIGNISENKVLSNTSYQDSDSGQNDLKQGRIDALIVIPANFGESIDSFWQNPLNASTWENTTIELYVDQGSLIVSSAIPPLIQQILLTTLYGEQATSTPQPVQLGAPEEIAAQHFTQFDYMAPGMFAFAAIFLTMIVAEGFVEERTQGILRRIQLTPTSSAEIITSSLIANMITAVLQVAIVFIMAGLMGFNPQTDVFGICFAFGMVLLLALCNVGFGLITATLAKSPGAATGISFAFILPQMFLGTFVPVTVILGQLVPSYYVTDALISILLRGASITSPAILLDLVIMLGFCVTVIVVGIVLFAKFGREK